MRTQSAELQKTQRAVQNTLALRIDEIDLRKKDLSLAIESAETEIAELTRYKERLEQSRKSVKYGVIYAAIREKDAPLAVATECQAARGKRTAPDLFCDDVDVKLAEVCCLSSIFSQLARRQHS